jgi:hypothetical protein
MDCRGQAQSTRAAATPFHHNSIFIAMRQEHPEMKKLKFGDVVMNAAERTMANALLEKFPTLIGVNVRGDRVYLIYQQGREAPEAVLCRAGEDFKQEYALLCAAEADADWKAAIPEVSHLTLLPWDDKNTA